MAEARAPALVRPLGFSESRRQAVHISMLGFALLLRYLAAWQAAGLAAAAFLFNRFLLPGLGGRRIARAEARGWDAGLLAYPISVLLLILIFSQYMHIVAAAWAIMAMGDGFATLFGKIYGRRPLPWNRDKSWVGLFSFLLFGGLGAAAMTWWVVWGRPLPAAPGLLLAAPLAAALAGAFIESAPLRLNDNFTVPLGSAFFLYSLYLVRWDLLAQRSGELILGFAAGLALSLLLGLPSLAAGWVSRSGFVAGLALGAIIYGFTGINGFLLLALFFLLGSLSTRLRLARIGRLRQETRKGLRGWREAFGNCSLPAYLAFLAAATEQGALFRAAFAAAIATAAADTVSGEIGQLLSRRPRLITNLKPVPAGTDGAVSLAGLLAGIAAALAISSAGLARGLLDLRYFIAVNIAALFGNLADSWLGATLERRGLIGNETVNFLNTATGAGILFLLAWI